MRAPLCSWAPPHAARPRGAAAQELKSSGAARLPSLVREARALGPRLSAQTRIDLLL